MGDKQEVTLIKVVVAMRGKWDKLSVDGLIQDMRTECLSKPEFISIWNEGIETKEMEIIPK